MKLTSSELYDTLGVSREWVRNHCRHLGEKGTDSSGYTVYYEEDQVVAWLNANAKFSRQTKLVDASQYLPEDALNYLVQIRNQTSSYEIKHRNILHLIAYHDNLYEMAKQYSEVNHRKRGHLPWVEVSYTIKSLNEISTMKQIKEKKQFRSDEMAARDIFLNGMIRMEVQGRVWYVEQIDRPKYFIEMPGDFE